MTLVNADGEVVQLRIFTIDEAKAWVGRVNDTLEELAGLITEGYHHQAWTALGHGSWAEMCEAEITVPQLSRDQRRELVGALRSEGLSTRAIGAAVGADAGTVRNDLRAGGEISPPVTVGTDGKTYPAERVELVEHDDELWLIDGDDAVIVEDDDLTPTATEPGDQITPNRDRPPITKPDLGDGVSHPARFSDAILERFAELLDGADEYVLDPFAGTGRIHELRAYGHRTLGVELEPEWAALHEGTMQGSALHLAGMTDAMFSVIATSPTYGNRLADHHQASDPHLRRSYTHDLGRDLHDDNSGAMQWGDTYREFHLDAWREAVRVLQPGGLFLLNIKDHIRAGEQQAVSAWHTWALTRLGCDLDAELSGGVPTQHLRQGGTPERAGQELVLVFVKAV